MIAMERWGKFSRISRPVIHFVHTLVGFRVQPSYKHLISSNTWEYLLFFQVWFVLNQQWIEFYPYDKQNSLHFTHTQNFNICAACVLSMGQLIIHNIAS